MLSALSDAVARLGDARLSFAALALSLFVFSLWVGAFRWQRLLAAMGCRVRVLRLVLVNLVGICANNVSLNSRVAGEGARLVALRMTDGVSADRLAVSTIYERLADIVGGVVIVVLAIPAAWAIGASLRVTRSVIGLVAVVALAALLVFVARRRLARLPIAGWWRSAVARYVVGRPTLALTTLCSVTISVQDPLRLMAVAAAFGVHLSMSQAALLSAASMFASGIPTVGALGGVEGGLIAALVALKVDVSTALAITALERGISLVFSTAAGGFAVFALGGGELWRRLLRRTNDENRREHGEHGEREGQAFSAPEREASANPAGGAVLAKSRHSQEKKREASAERGSTWGPPSSLGALRSDLSEVEASGGPSDTKRTVLVVCGNGPDPITLRKIEALATSGAYDVHLVYWRDGVSLRTYPFSVAIPESSVHPIDLPDPNGPPLRGLRLLIRFHARMRSVARTVRPDVVHAINFDMLTCGWLACVGHPERTLVYDLLDTQESLRRWPAVMLQRLVMRRVDRIYTTSPQFVSDFLRPLRLIRDDEHPVVIPNAPWRATFEGIERRTRGPFVIGYIGSFRCEPAISWLCGAVADARRGGLDVQILFAGTGEAQPLVERMAAEHSFVRHEGAYDYARDIRSLYERVDLVFAVYDVSWDKRTHLACRLSDAVAAGRPIVVSAGTYMGEIVATHRLGYVVDFTNPASLVAAIRDAVVHRDQWSDPSMIAPTLRAEHTFESYVFELRSTYAAARRERPDESEDARAALDVS